MKVKKFIAETMPEAMQQIRTELGQNAIILQSKEVKKGGVLGFFQRKQIEVVAALDPDPVEPNQKRESAPHPNAYVHTQTNQQSYRHEESTAHILSEIKQMKQLLDVTQSSAIPSSLEVDYVLPYTYLIEQEVDQTIAEEVILHVQRKQEKMNGLQMKQAIQRSIEKRLGNLQGEAFSFDKQIIHFIGPTGVGKTTTIAKVAAQALLEKNKSVAFITTDTYRIAAIEQLKIYARILDIPLEVAYSKEDYVEALHKYAHVDHIFVDTAGRNFRDDLFVDEITQFVEGDTHHQATMLVLSLSTKESDMIAIFNQFRHMNEQQIIFTKLDETSQYGSMLNFVLREGAHIAFLTNGQDVPDDVLQPTAEVLSSYVMSRYNDK